MKKYLLTVLLLSGTLFMLAQKFDREYFNFGHVNVPANLIYDQIKSYGSNVTTSGEFLPIDVINRATPSLNSYTPTGFNNADLKFSISYGPYQAVEEKTNMTTREEEVNKVKVKVNYYSRTLSFRFPISYRASNGKNGIALWNADLPNTTVHSISSSEYRTETEAFNYINGQRATLVTGKIAEIVNGFVPTQNAYFKRTYDFYPTKTMMDIYKFKKWKQDDEYNPHIKTIMKTFEGATYDEKPELTYSKIKADIDYLKSFEGAFNPTDKDQDILYWGNYYNLATIYYALDDFDNADKYINKLLDSSKKQTDNTKGLQKMVAQARANTKKHFLSDRHIIYNPVQDFKLTGLPYKSDAASASENAAGDIASGKVEANDEVVFTDNKTVKGKIVFDATKNQLQFIDKENPTKIEVLTPVNVLRFKKDSGSYEVLKNNSNPSNVVKQFFKI
jgi:tetratricopeptide (TPR) repeat protein